MERLTFRKTNTDFDKQYGRQARVPLNEIVDRLAELEDKMEDGQLVELPCKVGDTVYRAWYAPCRHGETYPDSSSCCGCEGGCDIKPTIFEEKASSLEYILNNMVLGGKYVYATREEAEQKLKEL